MAVEGPPSRLRLQNHASRAINAMKARHPSTMPAIAPPDTRFSLSPKASDSVGPVDVVDVPRMNLEIVVPLTTAVMLTIRVVPEITVE